MKSVNDETTTAANERNVVGSTLETWWLEISIQVDHFLAGREAPLAATIYPLTMELVCYCDRETSIDPAPLWNIYKFFARYDAYCLFTIEGLRQELERRTDAAQLVVERLEWLLNGPQDEPITRRFSIKQVCPACGREASAMTAGPSGPTFQCGVCEHTFQDVSSR